MLIAGSSASILRPDNSCSVLILQLPCGVAEGLSCGVAEGTISPIQYQ